MEAPQCRGGHTVCHSHRHHLSALGRQNSQRIQEIQGLEERKPA